MSIPSHTKKSILFLHFYKRTGIVYLISFLNILGALISAIIGWIYIRDIKNNSIGTYKNSDLSARKIIDFSLLMTIFSFSLLFFLKLCVHGGHQVLVPEHRHRSIGC